MDLNQFLTVDGLMDIGAILFHLYAVIFIISLIEVIFHHLKRKKLKQSPPETDFSSESLLEKGYSKEMIRDAFEILWLITGAIFSPERYFFIGILFISFVPTLFRILIGERIIKFDHRTVIMNIVRIILLSAILFNFFFTHFMVVFSLLTTSTLLMFTFDYHV